MFSSSTSIQQRRENWLHQNFNVTNNDGDELLLEQKRKTIDAIRKECGIEINPSNPIETYEQVHDIMITKTKLNLNNCEIQTLDPLIGFMNLKILFFNDNLVKDITPLPKLINLTVLSFDNNQVKDITPLSKLINLTLLYFNNNQVKDITPLSNLIHLSHLGFANNQIEDITPFSKLKKLEYVNLEWNYLDSFDACNHNQRIVGRENQHERLDKLCSKVSYNYVQSVFQTSTATANNSSSSSSNGRIVLGQGFFGIVYKGYDPIRSRQYAIKTNRIPFELIDDEEQCQKIKQSFQTELITLYQFNHPNIIKLHAYYITEDLKGEQYLLYEYAEKGSLQHFLETDSGRERLFSFGQRVKIATDIMAAINFLHQGNKTIKYCCHRDIKSGNIVLMNDFTAKLTDCGLAKSIPKECDYTTSGLSSIGKGTDQYMCPMYKGGEIDVYEPGCDIFSFGIVMIELWVGRLQNHKAESTTSSSSRGGGRKVNYSRKYQMERADIVSDIDEALDIAEFEGTAVTVPEYAKKYSYLCIQCIAHEIDDRPTGTDLLQRLREVQDQHEAGMKELEDVKRVQELENVPLSSVNMNCSVCRVGNIRCHIVANRYLCLPCLLREREQRMTNVVLQSEQRIRNENRELHAQTHSVLSSMARVLSGLDAILLNQIPSLFVMVPSEKAKLREHPKSWFKDKVRTKYYIYFVCSDSYKKVNPPLKFPVSKAWVRKVAPILSCSLYVLQIALGEASGGLLLGRSTGLGDLADTIFQEIGSEKLNEMLESTIEVLQQQSGGSNQDLVDSLKSRNVTDTTIRRLNKDSIEPILELASSQRGWYSKMKHVRHANEAGSLWIRNDVYESNRNKFELIQ